jgi:hypothetical protein
MTFALDQVQQELGIPVDAQLISLKPLADPEVRFQLFSFLPGFYNVNTDVTHAVFATMRRSHVSATGHQAR